MAKKNKTGVLKRLREVKKAEKAAMKREELRMRKEQIEGGNAPRTPEKTEPQIATDDDLAGYGFPTEAEDENDGDNR